MEARLVCVSGTTAAERLENLHDLVLARVAASSSTRNADSLEGSHPPLSDLLGTLAMVPGMSEDLFALLGVLEMSELDPSSAQLTRIGDSSSRHNSPV